MTLSPFALMADLRRASAQKSRCSRRAAAPHTVFLLFAARQRRRDLEWPQATLCDASKLPSGAAIAGPTWPGPVWRTPAPTAKRRHTERCCARARGSERAAPVGAVAARSQSISPTLRSPLEPSQADRHPDQLRNEPSRRHRWTRPRKKRGRLTGSHSLPLRRVSYSPSRGRGRGD
eukprot:scaffold14341_cov154-Isochrysis_galbana.AAC.1